MAKRHNAPQKRQYSTKKIPLKPHIPLLRTCQSTSWSLQPGVQVQGTSLKILVQRCKHLTCLLLQQTGLVGEQVSLAEWDKAAALQELDITATDLSTGVITDVLTRVPALTWLSAGQLDGMNDDVLNQ